MAKIIFGPDGSIYVVFPRFVRTEGLAAVATIPADQALPATVSLTEQGKVTGHLVKYSHHPDGTALFSQHGRVRSLIRKKAPSLDGSPGHLFTIQAQRLIGFQPPRSSDRTPRLNMRIEEEVRTIAVAAFWYEMDKLQWQGPEPPMGIQLPDGTQRLALFVAPPEGSCYEHHALVLVPRLMDLMSPGGEPALTFIGGFDEPQIATDHPQPTSFLALNYPTDDPEMLRRDIGSIDL